MKTIKYITLLAVGSIFAACEDLDTQPEGDTVTGEQKIEVYKNDPDRGLSAVNAVYTQMKTYEPNYDALGGSAHSDFGYASIMAYTDRNGEDMVSKSTGYNWFSNSIDYANRVRGQYNTQIIWNDLYSYIKVSNDILSSFDLTFESTETEFEALSATNKFSAAQGYAVRAFSYFNLVQLYAFNIVGHETDPACVIINESNSDEVAVDGALLSTVQEVYDFIYSDLDKAIKLLSAAQDNGQTRADARYVDLAVAYGLRARVNLVAQKWAEAAADAQKAIEESTAKIASIEDVGVPYFSDLSEGNWMWGINVEENDDIVKSGIVNYPSHCYTLNYGYANYSGASQISKKLYATIASTDIRKGWWVDTDTISANLNAEQQAMMKSYHYAPYTVCKFAPYKNEVETSTNANDIPLMRIEEMYLIEAEALARQGKDATTVLNAFVKENRDPQFNAADYTGDDLINEIWRQRRIEFWGEGLNWFDVMRMGKGIDRRGAGFAVQYVYKIDANDGILLWPVPESEVEANKALKEAGYSYLYFRPTAITDADIALYE
ncbi:MAG: RagB/SusD family nutrient uptake outer membrane protein [Bacteroidales bacterium]|nr:RagB/SusD family nutrient uptake outer membrane protein [Bacteroidales bacterium]